jgi:hypothetical protein
VPVFASEIKHVAEPHDRLVDRFVCERPVVDRLTGLPTRKRQIPFTDLVLPVAVNLGDGDIR